MPQIYEKDRFFKKTMPNMIYAILFIISIFAKILLQPIA